MWTLWCQTAWVSMTLTEPLNISEPVSPLVAGRPLVAVPTVEDGGEDQGGLVSVKH